ncbi:hypothetical protein BGX34_000206 [Mortierella sp. NVP85]|nr:hypothetical protein BGX34_000206 [Mortierella sp. NVP85]
MSKPVVAALRLNSTGQTLELCRDSTLLVGRSSFAGITSPHVESTGDKVTITRLGANRSLMDGKILEKNTPVPLENGALVTLLESEYQVTVEIPPINTPTVNNKPKEGEEQEKKSITRNPSVKAVQQQQRTSSTPKSPLKPSIAAMTRSHSILGAAPPRRESPRLAQKEKEAEKARKEADNAWKEETMRTLEEEEQQQQQNALEEDEATSESEDEDMAHQHSFAVSDESSMICSDLSDLDGRDDKDCVEIKDE